MSEEKPVRVRIENDGQPAYMTKITNAQTGEAIPHVFRVEMALDARSPLTEATLHLYLPIVNIVTEAKVVTHCPLCNQFVSGGYKSLAAEEAEQEAKASHE